MEAKEMLSVSETTLRRNAEKGNVPARQFSGRWYIDAKWVSAIAAGEPDPRLE